MQIRLDEEAHRRIKERGGSPWARQILLEALTDPEPALQLEPATEAGQFSTMLSRIPDGDPLLDELEALALPETQERMRQAVADGLCPRWMHHRHDVACALCGGTL